MDLSDFPKSMEVQNLKELKKITEISSTDIEPSDVGKVTTG